MRNTGKVARSRPIKAELLESVRESAKQADQLSREATAACIRAGALRAQAVRLRHRAAEIRAARGRA